MFVVQESCKGYKLEMIIVFKKFLALYYIHLLFKGCKPKMFCMYNVYNTYATYVGIYPCIPFLTYPMMRVLLYNMTKYNMT